MSFKSEFKLQGNTYEIIQCRFSLKQKYSQNGKPASGVHSGMIRVIIEGAYEGTFDSWISDPTKKLDGKIIFYQVDQSDTKFKEVTIEGAYLISLMESFIVDHQITQALLLESGLIDTDIGPHDDVDRQMLKNALSELVKCQQATGRSYCALLRISAEKITIDGVAHQN